MLEVGSKAPSFLLNNQDGNPVSLNDFAGQKFIDEIEQFIELKFSYFFCSIIKNI